MPAVRVVPMVFARLPEVLKQVEPSVLLALVRAVDREELLHPPQPPPVRCGEAGLTVRAGEGATQGRRRAVAPRGALHRSPDVGGHGSALLSEQHPPPGATV